jgi:BlaI family penicillinase repressor
MEHSFTPTEWKLMECLWEKGSVTGREAVDDLHARAGWSRSTTLTMLRRMTEKGAIVCRDSKDGVKTYAPLVSRAQAAQRETEDFLSRVYHGSVSNLVSAMTEKQNLTQKEIDELYEILRRAEERQ